MARPPFTISLQAAGKLARIERLLGGWEGALGNPSPAPRLRRKNRIRTLRDTLAIEGNELSLQQVTAVLDGKRVLGPAREILEVQNADAAYREIANLDPLRERSLLRAHATMMRGLVPDAGRYRTQRVGVLQGTKVALVAPPPHRVKDLMQALFRFLRRGDATPAIIVAIVFHYELELIHPFSDGNGRIGRLWQHALLRRTSPVFEHVPTESLIRARQSAYYRALAESDRRGSSEPFIELMLEILWRALSEVSGQLRGSGVSPQARLQQARAALGKSWFARRAYLALFPRLSTASASRDLAHALAGGALESRGVRALTQYRFR